MSSEQEGATEAVVISQQVIPYLRELGFGFIESEVKVSPRHPTTRADAIVYRDKETSIPYVVVEVKRHLSAEVSLLDALPQEAFVSSSKQEYDRRRRLTSTRIIRRLCAA